MLFPLLFEDRRDAGSQLARLATPPQLADRPVDAIVLALPRGGVPVAFEVARASRLPLDILVVRKLGAPEQRELALGAVATGGVITLNRDVLHLLGVSQKEVAAMAAREFEELARIEDAWRNGQPSLPIAGHTVILVDDGLATGASMRAAVQAVRPHARRIIVAVPVGAASTCRELESEVDRLLCLATPEPFDAVGLFYRNFEPTSDNEVRMLLAEARRVTPPAA